MFPSIQKQLLALLDSRSESIELALQRIPDKRLFVPIAPNTNSAGNLALHLAGNLRTLIAQAAGDVPYTRNRDAEFATTGLTGAEVLEEFRGAIAVCREVIERFDGARWTERCARPWNADESRGEHVLKAMEHLGYHAGQIVLIGKVMALIGSAAAGE